MDSRLIDTLTTLPLLQGIGKTDLDRFISSNAHAMMKYIDGMPIVMQDSPCRELHIVINGSVEVLTSSDEKRFRFIENIPSPCIIQPEALFGIATAYTHTFTAREDTKVLILPKATITKLNHESEVFRLNLLNVLATQNYRMNRRLWLDGDRTIDQLIIQFVAMHSLYPAGEKTLLMSMQELGNRINYTRKQVSKALHRMEKENLIKVERKKIVIPQQEKLTNLFYQATQKQP